MEDITNTEFRPSFWDNFHKQVPKLVIKSTVLQRSHRCEDCGRFTSWIYGHKCPAFSEPKDGFLIATVK